MSTDAPSERSTIRRSPDRGIYEREQVYAILDEGFVAHVGFSVDDQPFVIPMVYGRVGDTLYLHGASASRLIRTLGEGVAVSVSVTLLDGLVLARSAIQHSMNYRSVVVLGNARRVDDAEERLAALRGIVEHVVPDRWPSVRRPDAKELARTFVLAIALDEATAKQRAGPPNDYEADLDVGVWAGVVPISRRFGDPVPDPALPQDTAVPPHVSELEASRQARRRKTET